MKEKLTLMAPAGQVIVEVDPEDLGETEVETAAGVIVPKSAKKGDKVGDPIWGVVLASAIPEIGAGDEIVFDRVDGFRYEWDGLVVFSLYPDQIRGWVQGES